MRIFYQPPKRMPIQSLKDDGVYLFVEVSTFKHDLTIDLCIGVFIAIVTLALLIKVI